MTENNINALKSYMIMFEEFLKTAKPLPKLLDGNEICELLNIERGKKLGEIIKELQNAQMSGDVVTKEDAIRFLNRVFR